MQSDMIENAISAIYKNSANVLINSIPLIELSEKDLEILSGFHMNELYLIKEEDDYFCNIRADHFCIEYGYSEYVCNGDVPSNLILVTANHKGSRTVTLLKMP